jgi:hypothetical protein
VFGFADARLHVQGSCNQLSGRYEVSAEGQLKVGRMAATMMACEPASMQADSALTALLAKPLKVDLARGAAPVLRLVSASGEVLVLNGQATPEALTVHDPIFLGSRRSRLPARTVDRHHLPAGQGSGLRPARPGRVAARSVAAAV